MENNKRESIGLHDTVLVTVFTDEGFNQYDKKAKVIGSRTVNETLEYQVLFDTEGQKNFGCWVNASETTQVEENDATD